MMAEIEAMARGFYGYGRWDAPYWFIGPEQGGDNNELRAKAFLKLSKEGLCDCKEFHQEIQEFGLHREIPALVPTWRRLILLLKVFQNQFTSEELLDKEQIRNRIRNYQRNFWGMRDGDTCVIELSGMSARNSKVGERNKAFKEKYLGERIQAIQRRIHDGEFKPSIVVMYGFSEAEHWERLAGFPFVRHAVKRVGQTVYAFAPHPSAQKQEDSYWVELAEKLRKESSSW